MAAWASLLLAHSALVGVMERELVEARGLPLSWYEVLMRLRAAPEGGLRMQDLAGAVLLSKSGITRLVDRMEHAGLVRRVACPSDRRGTLAVITDEGRAVFRKAMPVHLRSIQEHFARHLSADDARTLERLLRRVLDEQGGGADAACSAAVGVDDDRVASALRV